MPMLLDIRDTVADYAELIARVVGVDVEVVDAGLNRLAGTGLYASGVGENIRAEGETYRHVMRIRRSFVMETPREHFICTRCPGRDLCRETLSISTPIIDGSDVLGVIGLVCSTDEDRTRVLGSMAGERPMRFSTPERESPREETRSAMRGRDSKVMTVAKW